MRKVLLIALLLLIPTSGRTQSPQVGPSPLTAATCPAPAGCLTLSVSGLAGVAIQVVGTYSGTISFEASVDGSTYVALNLTPLNSTTAATSTTSTGVWSGGVGGASIVRARMSSYTSGSASVTIKAAPTSARGGGGGSGAPTDATYITQTANGTLTAEQALGSLATGLMTSTTTTGVVSTLAPTDDNLVVGSGTAWALKALSSCSAADSAVTYNTTTNAFGCNTIAGGSPTIGATQVAYATAPNTVGGSSDFTWDSMNSVLSLSNTGNGGGTLAALGAGAQLQIKSGDGTNGAFPVGGEFSITTGVGAPDGSGDSGEITISSGSAFNGAKSGNVLVSSGQGVSDADSGDVVLSAGLSVSGTRGGVSSNGRDIINSADVSFQVYAGAANRSIELNNSVLAIDVPSASITGTLSTANFIGQAQVPVTAVGSLPTCDGGAEGTIRGVNDALLPAALAVVANGGAVHVPVYCDGTNWRVM